MNTKLTKILVGVVAVAIILLAGFKLVNAATILFPTGGGTGWGNLQSNTILLGNGTSKIATTSIGTLSASSPLSLSGVTQIVGTSRTLTLDTSGTWTGNAGTASALAANGANCSAGQYPLGVDTLGAVENCTVVAGGGVWPFTTTDTNYGVSVQSTTTPEWFKNGLFASSTSQLAYASTTALSASTIYAANFIDTSFTGSDCIGESSGVLTQATNCVSSLASADGSLTISSPTGNVDASLNLGHSNIWTTLQRFSNASTSLLSVTGTAYFGGSATSSFSSTGALTLATPLLVASGGTGKTTFTSSQLLYGNGTNALSSVATSSLSLGGGIDLSGTLGALVGGSAATLTAQVGTSSVPSVGNLAYWTGAGTPSTLGTVATSSIGAGTGLSFSGTAGAQVGGANGTYSVNTSQNITTLSNLTSNGYIKTSGSNGTLGVQAVPIPIADGGSATTTAYDTGILFYNSTLGTYSQASRANSNHNLVWDRTTPGLGIGTTTPWGLLSVSANIGIGAGVPQFVIGSSTATNLIVDQSGNVGIATTSPLYRLSLDRVAGSSIASSSILVTEYQPGTTTAGTISPKDSNTILWRLGLSATTLTLSNFAAGATVKVVVCNPGGAAGALTWATSPASILLWTGGTAPTQTTTANKCDVWSFIGTNGTSTLKILGAMTANF